MSGNPHMEREAEDRLTLAIRIWNAGQAVAVVGFTLSVVVIAAIVLGWL